MSWPVSLAVAVLCAITGGVGAGLLANLFVTWFRVTSMEGAAGYYVLGIGLLGIVGGFIVGLICARTVAAGASPGFLQPLWVGQGATAGVLLLGLGFGWLSADFSPRIDGRDLMLDVEVRFPPKIPLPDPQSGDLYRWNVTLTAMSGNRKQVSKELRLAEVAQVEGRNVVPASVFLHTSDPERSLGVNCGDHVGQFFDLPLPSKPTRADMEWSPWLTAPQANRLPIPGDMAVAVRYRVRLDEEPGS